MNDCIFQFCPRLGLFNQVASESKTNIVGSATFSDKERERERESINNSIDVVLICVVLLKLQRSTAAGERHTLLIAAFFLPLCEPFVLIKHSTS